MTRRNLVIVSRGPHSIPMSREPDANWDWFEIWWHPDDLKAWARLNTHDGPDGIVAEPDRAFRKFRAAFRHFTTAASSYNAVAILDDDIVPAPGVTWSKIFDLFDETGAMLGAPALTHDSFISHGIARRVYEAKYRQVNYLDCQAPIFSRAAIDQHWGALDRFGLGWALCEYWGQRCQPVVMLDATPVVHPREVGSIKQNGQEGCYEEYLGILQANGLERIGHQTLKIFGNAP